MCTGSNKPGFERFKIDILTPGIMDLSNIEPRYTVKINELPCPPLDLLLFHKLQVWDQRRRSLRQ